MTPEQIAEIISLLESLLGSLEDNATISLSDDTISDLAEAIVDELESSDLVELDDQGEHATGFNISNGSIEEIGTSVIDSFSEFSQVNGLIVHDDSGESYVWNTFSTFEPFIFIILLSYFVITLLHNLFNKIRGIY